MILRKYAKKALLRLSINNYQTLNRIELSRDRTLHNFNLFKNQHPGFEIMPVLKGNAYGHGLVEIAKILNEVNCPFLTVDGYFEAPKIRDISRHRILVMGYIKPENVKLLDVKRCSFVVQDLEGLKAFGRLGKPVRIHMELNTGMNRLGLQLEEIEVYLNTLHQSPNLELEGVMTHLADADNKTNDSFTAAQVELFDRLVEKVLDAGFKPKFIHLANTAGSVKAKSRYANTKRIGIGLYGINPLNPKDSVYKDLEGLQPTLSLKSTIIKVLDLKKGAKVSYSGLFTAPKDMRIGVLPLGYYECIPRALSNKGVVTYEGAPLPIVGRVCMNHTMIDISKVNIKVGAEVTVIDSDKSKPNSVTQISSRHQLFDYELLTSLSSNIHRKIV